MCFSKPKQPDYAAEARDEEAARQAKVRQSSETVNRAFDRFGPSYYRSVSDAYRDFYTPQVQDQAKGARRALVYRYADNANSSAANRKRAELERDVGTNIAAVESGSMDAANKARSEVEGKRSNLLTLAEAGGSQENIANLSNIAAQQGTQQPQFSPMADLFGKYTAQLGRATEGSNAGYQQAPFWQRQIDFLRGGDSATYRRGP